MKKLLIRFLQAILKIISSGIIRKYRPLIIGITGSYGKSSTKMAVFSAISPFMNVRASHGNFNNELGFPLSIIGDYRKISGEYFWLKVIFSGIKKLIVKSSYPQALVLEYAADAPGDLDYLISIARPDISVVTGVSKIPVHVEFYSSPEEVVTEKAKLISALSESGSAIINADDDYVRLMGRANKGKTVTFGYSLLSDIRLAEFKNDVSGNTPTGISFKIIAANKILPVKIAGTVGRAQTFAAGAAVAVASVLNLDLFMVRDALMNYSPLSGRGKIIKGVRGSWLIDDTYNAAPAAMESALEALRETKAKRRVAVLGHMAELGQFHDEAHLIIGKLAAKSSDLLFVIGEKAAKITEGALSAGMDESKIRRMADIDSARASVVTALQPGDLVLIKGSQSARAEKIVAAAMAEPERAKELLVRQYGKWVSG